jgi:multidrug efflux system membrane fusion protein
VADAERERAKLERWIVPALAIAALVLAVVTLVHVVRNPVTDDAIVTANVIDVVPQVSGTISELLVADNQSVAAGDLLFVIDPRPYELAVKRAHADEARIEGQIEVTTRRIQGQQLAVGAAKAAVRRAQAQVDSSSDTLARLEPLLAKEFVTPDKVEQARTAKAGAEAGLDEARKKASQAEADIDNLLALTAEHDAALAARGKAELDLSYCSVRAPFDARVVNLHTAVGQYVAPGPAPVFSLVDARHWYVLASYRETELAHIAPGMKAEAYLLTNPRRRFHGTVQGIGWAVNPEDAPISPGLPRIGRELAWVHIAQRFPVRILIDDPEPAELFRVGASAVAIVRGAQ